MTKHTDSSRSTDSGVSGNAQTMAGGSRVDHAKKWLESQLYSTVAEIPRQYVYALLADYTESACSRLASRVEELEWILSQQGICAECGAHFIVHKFKDGTMVKCEERPK